MSSEAQEEELEDFHLAYSSEDEAHKQEKKAIKEESCDIEFEAYEYADIVIKLEQCSGHDYIDDKYLN
ncbi:hypothetical protein TSAR_000842 [Trichomalopsis sarcophagae]|uniref:Uncharacterized protein n=1 Tax=Trichomalopsis sarcophagae TaxID=543379 RepID=A0A232EW40_9HYME|nr:hypothetical protein TSAR_000842 [Trichomalopsis sarcophagae]